MLSAFFESVVDLIVKTSTDLPPDVRAAMRVATDREEEPRAVQALAIIGQNIDLAAAGEGAICQDTGMPTFEVKTPVGVNQIELKKQIKAAVAEATKRGKLRPNSVDSITGENSGNNLGPGMPILHFEQWEQDEIEVKLILKGGGCENMNIQYSVPTELPHLGRADRTLEGVRKCILHAVWNAQGKGCAPGAIGVGIGGDRLLEVLLVFALPLHQRFVAQAVEHAADRLLAVLPAQHRRQDAGVLLGVRPQDVAAVLQLFDDQRVLDVALRLELRDRHLPIGVAGIAGFGRQLCREGGRRKK